jgi:hypothetical protein
MTVGAGVQALSSGNAMSGTSVRPDGPVGGPRCPRSSLIRSYIHSPLGTAISLKNHHSTAPALRPRSAVPPARLPLCRHARPHPTLLCDPHHAPIQFAHRKMRGRGGLRLAPHPAHPIGRKGRPLRCTRGMLDRCSRRPPDLSLLTTGVPHQIGCGH